MNSSSADQNLRRYSQSTCDLTIEDKKSPFPTWMKFNKPNPLKFILELKDSDRPDQPPIQITGDRGKLESFHEAVDSYVGKLLASAPLPQLNSTPANTSPAPVQSLQSVGQESGDLSNNLDRPIDALKMTGDRPHLEADGHSRHLLYLGNMANDNQVTVSLSTLQLFDLSSTLASGVAPVVADVPDTQSSPAIIAPPLAAASMVATTPVNPAESPEDSTGHNFSTDISEARVLLPSVNDAKDDAESEHFVDESGLGNDQKRGQSRFHLPKFKNGSESTSTYTDFSDSPLKSIWPWLGVGTVAAGIVAFSIFGSKLNNKPAVIAQNSPTPAPEAAEPVDPYQPSAILPPTGATPSVIPSNSSSPSPSVSLDPKTGSTLPSSVASLPGGAGFSVPSLPAGVGAPTFSGIPGGGISPSKIPKDARLGNNVKMPSPASIFPSQSANAAKVRQGNLSGTGNANRSTVANSAVNSVLADPTGLRDSNFSGSRARSSAKIDNGVSSRSVGNTPKNNTQPSDGTPPINNGFPDSVVQSDGGDLFGPSGSRNAAPIQDIPPTNTKPLEFPGNTSLDSTQSTDTRSYFQKRWKGDPNFTETLQYVIRVDKNGKVGNIEAQGGISQSYLDKTKFLRPGDKLAAPSSAGKDAQVHVILKPNGEVETFDSP